jgi:hypothetical protein
MNGTYFRSLLVGLYADKDYESCALCRIREHNNIYDTLLFQRGFCSLVKYKAEIIENKFIKVVPADSADY